MVRLGNAGLWILNLFSIIGKTRVQAETNIVPGAFIVEYEDGVDIDEHLASIHDVAAPRMKLNHTLFKGVSIQMHDVATPSQHMRLMRSNPVIKNIWPLGMYSVPTHQVHWTAGDHAVIKGPDEGITKARQQTADTYSPHIMTQVDKLRNQGFAGKGIKVAVVDTGVDYLHSDLGGCFGPGCLVSFGFDLVGDDYTGANDPVPDLYPFDCEGHGTHVSGIIAAQASNSYGFVGAATGVSLGHYRVFGCKGNVTDDVLISAFNMAYEAGADLISASLGGNSGWSGQPSTVALSRIVEKGVACIVSAGNDGSNGVFSPSLPATGKGVVSVASIDNWVTPELLLNATYITQGNGSNSFGFVAGLPAAWGNITLPLFAVSLNDSNPADACDPLPASTPDLSQYVVLIRRGTCTFVQKLNNAVRAGAQYVVVYKNVATGLLPKIEASGVDGLVAVAAVAADQGAILVAALASGQNVTVSMPDPKTASKFVVTLDNNVTGGFMSTFTSWGPTFEVEAKPQFGSPGGNIISTYPTALGSYAVLGGTSMACPLVTGIFALLMEIRGTKDPRTLINLLSSTAKANIFNDGNASFPALAPAAQQGAGTVQAFDAAYTMTELSVSSLSFNDSDNIIREQEFSISNNGNQTATYTIRHTGAASAYTFNDSSIYPLAFPDGIVSEYASLTFDVDNPFTIAAGERKIVKVNVAPPTGLDERYLPVYSGYIVINGSDSSALSVPYVGVFGSLGTTTVLDKNATYMTSSRREPNTTSIAAGRTFTLPPPGRSNDTLFLPNITDYPALQYSLAMGSALVRVDVVPVSVPPNTNITETLGLRTLGDVWMTPMEYSPRNLADSPPTINWDGRMSTDEYVPAGVYKMVVRALKIFGDRNDVNDYEVAESVEFGIQYMSNSSA
ncbi:unnamed protein product [Discula destructiva]